MDRQFGTEVALIARPLKNFPGGEHFGAMISGFSPAPFVIDLNKNNFIRFATFEEFCDGAEHRCLGRKRVDHRILKNRIDEVRSRYAQYSLIENNCESVARYIFEGEHRSYQIWAAVLIPALIAFASRLE